MNVERALRLLVEWDQQMIDPRPTPFGQIAELLVVLADHAEGSLRKDVFGDWRNVDATPITKRTAGGR